MGYPYFFFRCDQAQITTPGQPLGAVVQAPAQESGTLIKLPDQQQPFVGSGINAGGAGDDRCVELVDGNEAGIG